MLAPRHECLTRAQGKRLTRALGHKSIPPSPRRRQAHVRRYISPAVGGASRLTTMHYGPAPPDESSLSRVVCHATLVGHVGAVLAVRYNPNGQFALSCGKDRSLRLWSLAKGVQLNSYTGHGHEARCVIPKPACLFACLLRRRADGSGLLHVQVRDVACAADNSKLVSVGGDKQARA